MKTIKYISGILLALILTACGESNQDSKENKQESKEAAAQSCIYSMNTDSAGVYWTAYKHSNKVGVNGKFESMKFTGETAGASIEEILQDLMLAVDVNSINSKDTLRDGKLMRIFFANMAETEMIKGKVKSIENGEGIILMKMNGVAQEVPFTLTTTDELVEVRATIDILNFQANDAFDKLGEACAEKHTGGDGVKKFWSDVNIYIKAPYTKVCK